MAKKISWSVKVDVEGEASVSAEKKPTFEAFDKIEVTIPKTKEPEPAAGGKGGKKKEAQTPQYTKVEAQPGNQVEFLLISADKYADDGDNLHYCVKDPKKEAKRITLDSLQLFPTEGFVKLLEASPKCFYFHNATQSDVAITIIIGRKA